MGLGLLHPNQAKYIRTLIPALAQKYGLRLYETSQNSNHLHLLVKTRTRKGLKLFLIALSSKISMKVTGSRKGKPFGKKFFDSIPFSRIVPWGKAYRTAKAYVFKNILEASGEISYAPRKAKSTVPL